MVGTGTAVSADAAVPLSRPAVHGLWLDVLARQGLGGGRKQRSVHDVADRSLGLHAARLLSPFTTVLARVEDPSAADGLFPDGSAAGRLVTVRCMRKTLHSLPERMAGTAHTATRHFRVRDARRLAFNAGMTPGELDGLVEEIRGLLRGSGALGHREIESAVSAQSHVSTVAVRAALKFAWEAGHVVYRNASAYWNRERRVFAAAHEVSRHITATGDQAGAADVLVASYFERYGPASVKDAMWWSGLNRTAILRGLAASGRPVATVTSPWCADPLHAFEEQILDSAARPRNPADGVDFLAHEDVALKAYFQTRRRYLADLPSRVAFNQIGEVLPTIIRGGRVVGLWRWVAAGRHVEWELFTACRSAQAACAARAEELTSALRRRHDPDRSRSSHP